MAPVINDGASSASGMMQIAEGDDESSVGGGDTINQAFTNMAPNLREKASDDTDILGNIRGEGMTAKEAAVKFQHMSARNKKGTEMNFGLGLAGQGAAMDDDSSNGDLDGQMKMDNDSESAISGMM